MGTRAAVTSRVLRPRGVLRRAQWAENEMPVELVREAVRLRALMAHPRGGTWTWAALSMKSSEGYKLISDFDYDREPVLDPPYTAEDCAKELEVFPPRPRRDPRLDEDRGLKATTSRPGGGGESTRFAAASGRAAAIVRENWLTSSIEGNAVFSKCEVLLRDWLAEEGADRVDVDYQAIHRVSRVRVWLTQDGERNSVYFPSEIGFELGDVRPSQVDPRRGAWLWSHFWMEASDGVLHQEADWMREPVISARPIGGADAVVELEYYPRDPEWIPEWMAAKIAAYHEEEARERQKADTEDAQAEGASGSGRSGE